MGSFISKVRRYEREKESQEKQLTEKEKSIIAPILARLDGGEVLDLFSFNKHYRSTILSALRKIAPFKRKTYVLDNESFLLFSVRGIDLLLVKIYDGFLTGKISLLFLFCLVACLVLGYVGVPVGLEKPVGIFASLNVVGLITTFCLSDDSSGRRYVILK